MVQSASVSTGALSYLLNVGSTSWNNAEANPARRVSVSSSSVRLQTASTQHKGTNIASSQWDWPLPTPVTNLQEPEGFSDSADARSNSSKLIQENPSAPQSPKARTRAIVVEVRVGAGRAGKFTPEKVKLLRQKTRESESHHDLMYHSGLAARLA
uniref:Uncharacterized protein n=1 Tax=Micrasterias denticulata TaxID=407018 RepID=G4V4D8_9VIRI|nr:hypothetical protein [Micrasterias denticulata]